MIEEAMLVQTVEAQYVDVAVSSVVSTCSGGLGKSRNMDADLTISQFTWRPSLASVVQLAIRGMHVALLVSRQCRGCLRDLGPRSSDDV